jgi:cytoplasmic iron level regulating protein YaaA (DUF328/UPF0246 family)
MYIILSPAKRLAHSVPPFNHPLTPPLFKDKTNYLVENLKQMTITDLEKCMTLSNKLASLNFDRFQAFDCRHEMHLFPALFYFEGDVYQSLNARSFNDKTIVYAQTHLGILSGLYGIIEPQTGIQAYRLEMGTRLSPTLYSHWQVLITTYLNERLLSHSTPYLINLASKEYSDAIDTKTLIHPMITIDFKDNKNGSLKTIGILAKKARGAFAREILLNEIDSPDALKTVCVNGYTYSELLSTETKYIFVR